MKALSELFDSTVLALPCLTGQASTGKSALVGKNLSVAPLSSLSAEGGTRKLLFPFWLLRNLKRIAICFWNADALHAPIPGDVGTIGMIGACLLRKPLFVRHCGNWLNRRTTAEKFWRWFIEHFAGGRNVMLATGGAASSPSPTNPNVRWFFASSLTQTELSSYGHPRSYPSGHRIRLITAGRQERGKGTDLVIRSLPLLTNQFPALTLDVVGNGNELGQLKRLADSLDVATRVTFHGQVDHMRVMELLQSADIFCFPTASESFGKVILEALACGLPVITNPVSVLCRLVADGAGQLLKEHTPAAVVDAVRKILSDKETYEDYSRRALEIASDYSLERWRDEIGAILQAAWKQPLTTEPDRHSPAITTEPAPSNK